RRPRAQLEPRLGVLHPGDGERGGRRRRRPARSGGDRPERPGAAAVNWTLHARNARARTRRRPGPPARSPGRTNIGGISMRLVVDRLLPALLVISLASVGWRPPEARA